MSLTTQTPPPRIPSGVWLLLTAHSSPINPRNTQPHFDTYHYRCNTNSAHTPTVEHIVIKWCAYAGVVRASWSASAPDLLQRVTFKVLGLVHQSLAGVAPAYLVDDCRTWVPTYDFRCICSRFSANSALRRWIWRSVGLVPVAAKTWSLGRLESASGRVVEDLVEGGYLTAQSRSAGRVWYCIIHCHSQYSNHGEELWVLDTGSSLTSGLCSGHVCDWLNWQ